MTRKEVREGIARLEAGFMQPEVCYGTWITLADGGIVPAEFYSESDHGPRVGRARKGWAARLSASGYMDCTEFGGVHRSELAAARELVEMYDGGEED